MSERFQFNVQFASSRVGWPHTQVQSMLGFLSKQGIYRFTMSSSSSVEMMAFFFKHRKTIQRFNRFNTVVVVDFTYRTNRLCMPFLEIIGMNLNNSAFILCGCFITGKSSEGYKWALEQMRGLCFIDVTPKVIAVDRELSLILTIKEIFPDTTHVLCR